MNRTAFLELVLKLAGYYNISIEIERFEGNVNYKGSAERKIDNEIEPLSFEAIGFENALADLLAVLYDTVEIDFETNAALLDY